jgi:hypothetical protein
LKYGVGPSGTVYQRFTTSRESLMDVAKMLADLKDEREQIEEAILTLERLAQGRGSAADARRCGCWKLASGIRRLWPAAGAPVKVAPKAKSVSAKE